MVRGRSARVSGSGSETPHRERGNWNFFAVVSGEPPTGRIGLTGDDIARKRLTKTIENGDMEGAVWSL